MKFEGVKLNVDGQSKGIAKCCKKLLQFFFLIFLFQYKLFNYLL